MRSSDQENKARDREIAANEAERQTLGDVRVSVWTIAATILAGAIAFGIGWVWLSH